MQTLDKTQAQALIDEQLGGVEQESDRFQIDLRIPCDAGCRTVFARRLVALLPDDRPVCLYITGWSIWPSNQHMHLFELTRRGIGETRPLREVPAHLFEPDERETLEAFCCLVMYFLWDAHIVTVGGDVHMRLSHDEFVSVDYRWPSPEVRESLLEYAKEER